MSVPPIRFINDIAPQAKMMAKECKNERMAMILQYVALGSMIVMTGITASQFLKDMLKSPKHGHDHNRSR